MRMSIRVKLLTSVHNYSESWLSWQVCCSLANYILYIIHKGWLQPHYCPEGMARPSSYAFQAPTYRQRQTTMFGCFSSNCNQCKTADSEQRAWIPNRLLMCACVRACMRACVCACVRHSVAVSTMHEWSCRVGSRGPQVIEAPEFANVEKGYDLPLDLNLPSESSSTSRLFLGFLGFHTVLENHHHLQQSTSGGYEWPEPHQKLEY
jgi:hypothetical protein